MKRILVLLLCLTMIAAMAACGDSSSSGGDSGSGTANADNGNADSGNADSGNGDASNSIAAKLPYRQTIASGHDSNMALCADGTVYTAAAKLLDVEPKDYLTIDCYSHYIGIKKDGSIGIGTLSGYHKGNFMETSGMTQAKEWTDIVAVAAGGNYFVGLHSDGTVEFAGNSLSHFKDMGDWTNIKKIDAGEYGAVGLKNDGTVVTSDFNYMDLSDWTDIVDVSCSSANVYGVKSDGTVLVRRKESSSDRYASSDPMLLVDDWTDIVAISAGLNHVVGLRSDGTVVSTKITKEDFDLGQTDVEGWTDIVEISANYCGTLGLRSDGTVVYAGDDEDAEGVDTWTNVLLP